MPGRLIPKLPGWRDRSLFIERHAVVSFFHNDPYAQALAKIERDHLQDTQDMAAMIDTELIAVSRLTDLFKDIQSSLYRYPAVNPQTLAAAVGAIAGYQ